MSSYYECPECGEESLHVWKEQHEYWGSICYEEMSECENERCGEEKCAYCGEYSDDELEDFEGDMTCLDCIKEQGGEE